MTQELSYETLRFLRDLVADEFGDRHQAARPVLAELDRALAAKGRPTRYTLRQETPSQWHIGAGDGVAVPERSGGGNEIGRALAMLETAVTWPGDPVRVLDFMGVGQDLKNVAQSAGTMLSRVRRWIADEADVGLADLLKAGITLRENEFGNVVVVYAPGKDAPPIATSLLPP